MEQTEDWVGPAKNISSCIDISKQNEVEVDVPSHFFVQYVLLFCIVHQVPHYPCNTAADVCFSLWSSAAVQNPKASSFHCQNPAEKTELNNKNR